MQKKQGPQKRHLLFTCFDDRLDRQVATLAGEIRTQGILTQKTIVRLPGGVHLHTARQNCRDAFYKTLESYRTIAGIDVFHLWPHTNCQFCGIEVQEKLGNGTQSDLRFHVRSAEKLRHGVVRFFEGLGEEMPEIDVRVLLTIDQRIVTVEEAIKLLPHIPESHGHGHRCCGHENHEQHFSV